MEVYNINYTSTGRDIIRFKDTKSAKGGVLIMADPDYDLGLKDMEQVISELKLPSLKGEVSKQLSDMRFPRLSATKEEADEIEKLLKGQYEVKNFQDKKALEGVLSTYKQQKIVHISTHGYFLEKEKKEPQTMGIDNEWLNQKDRIKPAKIENPMLRSGLVFAGVNASLKEKREEGILTAEKVLGLDFKGTELVVLSACETGVGDINNGEGVFGLKRAFILSGAKSLVMSLWKVEAKATRDFMIDFYKLLQQGKAKAEALKQAKSNMKAKKDNPYYWAAFVMTGNPQ